MPQYKQGKYGLHQYGLYQTRDDTTVPSLGARWQFQRSRLGARLKDGTLYWVYQHRPVRVRGYVNRFRLKSNTGDTLYMQQLTLPGNYTKVRLSSPNNLPTYSPKLQHKGGFTH